MPLQSSPEQPVPLRTVARLIADWVGRLGRVWVEGQVAQLSRRPGAGTAFLTLRDPVAAASMQVAVSREVLDAVTPPLVEGAREYVRHTAVRRSDRLTTHHHGEADHLAWLERPFAEALRALEERGRA